MKQHDMKTAVTEFFSKNRKDFMSFGAMFINNLTNEELINELAKKDLEKLAKVFKLVFELLVENSRDGSDEKLAELLEACSALGKEETE